MIQIAHCDLHQKCKMKKKMMMFTESRGPSRIKIIVHFVGLRAKALEMFVHVDDDRRHAEPCTLILIKFINS